MSIISSEIEAQKQRDPSYIDSGLQWAWGRGYKAGASRGITEEEICRRHGRNPKVHHAPRRVVGEHHQNRVRRGKKKGNGGVSRPRARERKPAWLRAFIPKTSPLVVTVCEGCGLYVIEDRETVWESWDYGCVAGDDLTVAIILGRPLTRVTWLPSVGHPLLRSTCGDAGIRPDGQYLAMHMCHLARISVKPFKPPKRERPPGKPWGGPKLSKQEIAEFKRIWNMPYSRLKYEKAPTMVGQGDEKQTLF